MKNHSYILLISFLLLFFSGLNAQNPIIRDQFTADPTARVFNGKVYVYPSHDILGVPGKGRPGWFNMEDYHVFSSENLTHWTDHGVIINQKNVPWVNDTSYSMWAPDCIFRNGKYYFYFPANSKDTSKGKRFAIGVAISDNPEGPFVPEAQPINGVAGIDPNVFIDKDGQAYLYWAARNELFMAKLKDNMLELASEPQMVEGQPKGFKEGPYLFERNGKYYFTYPHVEKKTERLAYAIGDNPMGPFKFMGVIMDESPVGCWTNHHSFIEYNNQWYLFYHHNDYSPQFDKTRSIKIDSMFFNEDGTIRKVIPTHRGVGLTSASSQIQMDRYSYINNASIEFLNDKNTFEGWKTILKGTSSWVQYNAVDFGKNKFNSVKIKSNSREDGVLELRMNSVDGKLVSTLKIEKSNNWKETKFPISNLPSGITNLVLKSKDNNPIEIDWISFE